MTTPRSDAFVFFGATGDLAFKEIFPALYALTGHGKLDMPIIGVARSALSGEQFQDRARDSLKASGAFDERDFEAFARRLHYLKGDYQDPATFERLEQALQEYSRPLFYMAIPPSMFAVVARGIASKRCGTGARLVIEKPFGRDLASARALNKTLHQCFPETSLYRMDHFLGKETVENLVYFRFVNTFVEPVWCRDHIQNVQITMAEDFGVAGRGAFYDEVGAIRDVVQNHLFQVLSLLAIEPPTTGGDPDSLHDEQLKVFRSMRPLRPADVVFGQFSGYRDEPGVAPDSRAETYVAMRLHIDNDRWSDVPFYVRTGKCLPITCTEVRVTLKRPEQKVFSSGAGRGRNYFRLRLDPSMQIAIGAYVKEPGRKMTGHPVELIAHRGEREEMAPYERLLGDAINGDTALFTRSDNVEEAWRVVEGVLDHHGPIAQYSPGSWGPESSRDVLMGDDQWHNPSLAE